MKIIAKNKRPVKMRMAPKFYNDEEISSRTGTMHALLGGPLVTDWVK